MSQSDSGPQIVYGCTNPECGERMRGVTDESGLWCSACHADLTTIALDGVDESEIVRSYPEPLDEFEAYGPVFP